MNDDFDSEEYVPVCSEDYFFDEDGSPLNCQIFSHGTSQTHYDARTLYEKNEDGTFTEVDPTTCNGDVIRLYEYWDGNNYRCLVLESDHGFEVK